MSSPFELEINPLLKNGKDGSNTLKNPDMNFKQGWEDTAFKSIIKIKVRKIKLFNFSKE